MRYLGQVLTYSGPCAYLAIEQFEKNPDSVVYKKTGSADRWQSPPSDINEWDVANWTFAFLQMFEKSHI